MAQKSAAESTPHLGRSFRWSLPAFALLALFVVPTLSYSWPQNQSGIQSATKNQKQNEAPGREQSPTQSQEQSQTQTPPPTQTQMPTPAIPAPRDDSEVLPPPIDIVTYAGKVRRHGGHFTLNDHTVEQPLVLENADAQLKKFAGRDVVVAGPLTPDGRAMRVQSIEPVIAGRDKR